MPNEKDKAMAVVPTAVQKCLSYSSSVCSAKCVKDDRVFDNGGEFGRGPGTSRYAVEEHSQFHGTDHALFREIGRTTLGLAFD
jgi:hypothetical protein